MILSTRKPVSDYLLERREEPLYLAKTFWKDFIMFNISVGYGNLTVEREKQMDVRAMGESKNKLKKNNWSRTNLMR